MENSYQICKRCIMDTSASEIKFDSNGFCNFCNSYLERLKNLPQLNFENFKKILMKIKKQGEGKDYDCIIGLSGGVDSSYLAYLIKKEWGLRPLALHLDNGWNSEIASRNIKNLVKKLDIDLYTCVINWEEFRDLQLAYLKASVLDIEAITDHAIAALLYRKSSELGIKYILSGGNLATEGIFPKSWSFNKTDLINLEDIHSKFGNLPLNTFPKMGFYKWVYYTIFKKIRYIMPLNYIDYNKAKAKRILLKELEWKDYGGKHHESLFTKFYQNYILPTKFKIDKRRAHLSTLICSGQIIRKEALDEMKKSLYNEEELKRDTEYVIKKFGLSLEEFKKIMDSPPKNHLDYKSDRKIRKFFSKIYRTFDKYG
jgi:N-acetyl sugar amidotransferase